MALELFLGAIVIFVVSAIASYPNHGKIKKIVYGFPFDHEQKPAKKIEESFEYPMAGLSYSASHQN